MEYAKRPALCTAESDPGSGRQCPGTAYGYDPRLLCIRHLREAEAATDHEHEDVQPDAEHELSPTMARLRALARRPSGQNSTGT
jgi:hypothetical protein